MSISITIHCCDFDEDRACVDSGWLDKGSASLFPFSLVSLFILTPASLLAMLSLIYYFLFGWFWAAGGGGARRQEGQEPSLLRPYPSISSIRDIFVSSSDMNSLLLLQNSSLSPVVQLLGFILVSSSSSSIFCRHFRILSEYLFLINAIS